MSNYIYFHNYYFVVYIIAYCFKNWQKFYHSCNYFFKAKFVHKNGIKCRNLFMENYLS